MGPATLDGETILPSFSISSALTIHGGKPRHGGAGYLRRIALARGEVVLVASASRPVAVPA
jgi:hypothetical protein